MLGKYFIRKSLTLLTAVAVWSAFSMSVIASPNDVMGEITVNGQVSVNGQYVVSNSTVTSGSTITTGTNSSAVINLGKNGRVEVLSDTSLTLKFTDNSIIGMLSAGMTRISNMAGVATSVTTKNATVVADMGQSNTFTVDVGCADEARCSQTHVETIAGLVSLRSGSTDKQVVAGTDATYGNPSQTGCKPCLRPGPGAPIPTAGIGIVPVLIALIGGVAAAILLNRKNELDINGNIDVLSPNRP